MSNVLSNIDGKIQNWCNGKPMETLGRKATGLQDIPMMAGLPPIRIDAFLVLPFARGVKGFGKNISNRRRRMDKGPNRITGRRETLPHAPFDSYSR